MPVVFYLSFALGLFCTLRVLFRTLFEQLDSDKDGKISYQVRSRVRALTLTLTRTLLLPLPLPLTLTLTLTLPGSRRLRDRAPQAAVALGGWPGLANPGQLIAHAHAGERGILARLCDGPRGVLR